jgi:hypothetical protein
MQARRAQCEMIEQWCVVASQVAPSTVHQQSAVVAHQPGSPMVASTQPWGIAL